MLGALISPALNTSNKPRILILWWRCYKIQKINCGKVLNPHEECYDSIQENWEKLLDPHEMRIKYYVQDPCIYDINSCPPSAQVRGDRLLWKISNYFFKKWKITDQINCNHLSIDNLVSFHQFNLFLLFIKNWKHN